MHCIQFYSIPFYYTFIFSLNVITQIVLLQLHSRLTLPLPIQLSHHLCFRALSGLDHTLLVGAPILPLSLQTGQMERFRNAYHLHRIQLSRLHNLQLIVFRVVDNLSIGCNITIALVSIRLVCALHHLCQCFVLILKEFFGFHLPGHHILAVHIRITTPVDERVVQFTQCKDHSIC